MTRGIRAALAGLFALASTAGAAGAADVPGDETPIDVPHRVIDEPGFEASMALRVGEVGDGFRVEIGAAVHASRAVIEIHRARGSYRFHADGSELEDALQRRKQNS